MRDIGALRAKVRLIPRNRRLIIRAVQPLGFVVGAYVVMIRANVGSSLRHIAAVCIDRGLVLRNVGAVIPNIRAVRRASARAFWTRFWRSS